MKRNMKNFLCPRGSGHIIAIYHFQLWLGFGLVWSLLTFDASLPEELRIWVSGSRGIARRSLDPNCLHSIDGTWHPRHRLGFWASDSSSLDDA